MLLIIVGFISVPGITSSFAQTDSSDWMEYPATLWSNGEISNREFVNAMDYLSDQKIINISPDDGELQKYIYSLTVSRDKLQKEANKLREENEGFRALLDKRLNESTEFQAIKSGFSPFIERFEEVTENMDSWTSNIPVFETPTFTNVDDAEEEKVKSNLIYQINELKIKEKNYENTIRELEENIVLYQNDIELMELENQNKLQSITTLKERSQENNDDVNQFIQSEGEFELLIDQLERDIFIQKQKIIEYENEIKSFDKLIQNEQSLIDLEKQKSNYDQIISELEDLNKIQKADVLAVTTDLESKNLIVKNLYAQITRD